MRKLFVILLLVTAFLMGAALEADAWFGKKRRARRSGSHQTQSTGGYNSKGGFMGQVPDSYFDQAPAAGQVTIQAPSVPAGVCQDCQRSSTLEAARAALEAAKVRLADQEAEVAALAAAVAELEIGG